MEKSTLTLLLPHSSTPAHFSLPSRKIDLDAVVFCSRCGVRVGQRTNLLTNRAELCDGDRAAVLMGRGQRMAAEEVAELFHWTAARRQRVVR